jgi:PAS domain S-box-containing protein
MKKARIIIVEDELIIIKNIEKQLQKAGYEISGSATSGEEAIMKAQELRPDLMLMDIRLSGEMDGVATAEQVRNRFDIPVIFLTAYADNETLQRAKVTDPFGYVLKPFEPTKLRSSIEIALYKHNLEKKLKESESRFRVLAASAPVGIFQTDTNGDCVYVNKRWCQLAGISGEEAIKDGWRKGLHPDDRAHISDCWYHLTRTGGEFSMEYRFVDDQGKITWVFGHAEPLTDDSGKKIGFIGTITDITARKELEEKRLTGKKLESIGILAGGIAHDFNNLLSVITGNISMLKVDENVNHNQYVMLEHIDVASKQAAELAQKLITFSKGGWLNCSQIIVSQLISNVINYHFPKLEKNINFQVDLAEGLLPLDGDDNQLKQVVFNLIRNAVEAIEDSEIKRIHISAENIPIPDPGLALDKGAYVRLLIKDSGPGIPADLQGKIFDPYFTTKPMGSQKGLGLGLALCYSIIGKHGGHIRVLQKVEEDYGTGIEVYLPVNKDPAPEPHKSESKKETPPSPGYVLVVDDDEIIQDVLEQMLKRLGYRMKICDEGRDAIESYKHAMDEGQVFDILLMDLINKKGMGGKEAFKKLIQIDPSVKEKTIAISGFSDESDKLRLLNDGFIDVLFKPFKWKDLKQVLEKYFQKP